ncbi:hypothetical protein [Enterococcus gallinarum]|uniref:hypothetical protein n=1 Tax=Enterococcus gallinarum TaxID=1353 RepID=UPI00214B3F82|nr:hypothetical protein [Enterococcus gallinarum]MCR1946124.1 hypothetical protein [Enterococcus gallinarum]
MLLSKNTKIFGVIAVVLIGLLPFVSIGTTVQATEINNEVQSETVTDLQEIDKYVEVENNQLVLNVPETVNIDQAVLSSVTSRLKDVNADVLNNNGHINTTTKEINYANNISSRALASHQKNTFWWGVRHIFRTNAAAKNFTYQLRNLAYANTGLTILGTVLGMGIGGAVPGGVALYANKMANDVDYVKTLYPKIELNVTYALVYRVIEWRD